MLECRQEIALIELMPHDCDIYSDLRKTDYQNDADITHTVISITRSIIVIIASALMGGKRR